MIDLTEILYYSFFQNSLDPRTVTNIIHDIATDEKTCRSKYFGNSFNFFKRKFFTEKIAFIKMVTSSTSHLIDIMKDFFILFQVCLSQGGLALLMLQPEPYIKGVWTMWTLVMWTKTSFHKILLPCFRYTLLCWHQFWFHCF